MKPALATRSLVAVAVLATAVLSYWGGAKRLHALHVLNVEAAVPPSVRHAAARDASHPVVASGVEPAAKTEPAAPRVRLAELRAPLSETSDNDPFAVLSWLPPPPPPPPVVAPAPEPAPPPSAPALPFVYLGTLNPDAAKPQVFISSGDRLLIVSPGEVVDGTYRFVSIAATGALFTYLPLNQQQVMPIQGEGN
jgi:hypothetical protein